MKILFDHNVPHKLRSALIKHEVKTADEMGWSELENGALLRATEDAAFEVMVTADKNLSYQQNLTNRRLALVVLSTNNWNILKLQQALIIKAADAAKPASFVLVEIP